MIDPPRCRWNGRASGVIDSVLSGWSSALCPDGSQAAARWAAPCPVTKSTCFLPLTFMPNPEGNLELGEDRQNHPFISACGQRTANAVSGKFIFPSFIWELIKDVYSQGILWRLCRSELAKKPVLITLWISSGFILQQCLGTVTEV